MSFFSGLPLVGRLVAAGSTPTVQLQPVPIHAVETAPEKRPRTVKHLLRANHVNHALLTDHLRRFNPLATTLCAAYLLGADSPQLHDIYDAAAAAGPDKLEDWTASPAEIAEVDWRDFWGDRRYQRAYVDFFEDVLAEHSVAYNWHVVVDKFLLEQDDKENEDPLVLNLVGGLGHPLVHLAYAFEMDSRVLAMEALALAAVSRNFLHGYLTKTVPVVTETYAPPLQTLLDRVVADNRLDGLAKVDLDNTFEKRLEALFADAATETALLEHWNAWPAAVDPTARFRDVQETAVNLLVSSSSSSFDYHLAHLLIASHGARVVLPNLPRKYHVPLLHQWWLLALGVYVAAGRPSIRPDSIPKEEHPANHDWDYVEKQAISSQWRTDAIYVQSIRAIKEAATTWGDDNDRYLNAAVHFVDHFDGWKG